MLKQGVLPPLASQGYLSSERDYWLLTNLATFCNSASFVTAFLSGYKPDMPNPVCPWSCILLITVLVMYQYQCSLSKKFEREQLCGERTAALEIMSDSLQLIPNEFQLTIVISYSCLFVV